MNALILLLGTFFLVHAEADILDLEENNNNWVDPNDPSAGDPVLLFGAGSPMGHCSSQTGDILSDPSLRLILRRLFQQIHVDPSQKSYFSRIARLTLSSYNMAVVAEYLDGDSSESELSQRELVRSALHGMVNLIDEDEASYIDSVITFLWPWVVLCNMIILPPAFFFILRNIMSTRSFWITFVSIIILLSMITTYNKMYQEKVAQRLAATAEMQGDACAPSGLIEQGLDFLSGLVSFKKKSPCLKFIETQTVSIVAEISLLDVFSHVISNGIYSWLSSLAPHLNKFFRELCDGIPYHVLILVFASMIFFFVRIKTPIFTIEPLFITLLGNVFGTVVQGLTGVEERTPALPSSGKERIAAIQDPNVTPRTPERNRRLHAHKKEREVVKMLPPPDSEENTTNSSFEEDSGQNRSRSRSRSISRGRVPHQ